MLIATILDYKVCDVNSTPDTNNGTCT